MKKDILWCEIKRQPYLKNIIQEMIKYGWEEESEIVRGVSYQKYSKNNETMLHVNNWKEYMDVLIGKEFDLYNHPSTPIEIRGDDKGIIAAKEFLKGLDIEVELGEPKKECPYNR